MDAETLAIHTRGAKNFTDEIVEGFPNRLCGTEACKKATERIREELETCCDSGTATIEEWEAHPGSYVKWFRNAVFLCFLVTALSFLSGKVYPDLGFIAIDAFHLISVPVLVMISLLAISQFVLQASVFDFLFKKAPGYNTFGMIEPQGGKEEAKRRNRTSQPIRVVRAAPDVRAAR